MSKTALITGASRGIGEAIAIALAENGYNLSLCCHSSQNELESLGAGLRLKYHIDVITHIGDVGDYNFVSTMVSDTLDHFGSVDVLINNAGISMVGLLSDMSVEEWDRIIATNLSSVFYTSKCVIPSMVSHKSGHIIQISSVWGNVGASCEVAYSACKGGINSFTRALGKELAPSHIQVNAIACGCIDTSMNNCFSPEEKAELAEEIPAGRFGEASEVAQMVAALLNTPEYLNAQIITLDGGWI